MAGQEAVVRLLNWVLFPPARRGPDPKRILVLRVAALGDFMMSVPALALLRRRFPDSRITLLTTSTTDTGIRRRVSQYAGDAPDWFNLVMPGVVDDIVTWRASGLKGAVAELRPKIDEFSPEAAFLFIDVAAPLAGVMKKMLFLRLVGVRCAVFGWHRRLSFSLLWLGRTTWPLFEHHVLGLIRGVREHPAFQESNDIRVEFPLTIHPDAIRWARDLWQDNRWTNRRVVALAPGSIQPHKRWPLERFSALCASLCESPDTHLVILGTPADEPLGQSLAQALKGRITNLAGKTSISQSAALLQRCALLVGNDGGAMHLGAAVGCRVVSIIPGIQLPGAIDPWGNTAFSVRHPVPCAPCLSFTHCPKGHNRCIKDLTESEVLNACNRAQARSA